MTTPTKTPRKVSRHDATFNVTPDDARAAGLAASFGARTRRSPYAMTRVRASKCKILYDAGFSASGEAFTHPTCDRRFSLPEALVVARVLTARTET